jgi:hypothetical protein
MIRKDFYANPWRDHVRQNGVTRGRQDWSDLQDAQDKLDAPAGIIHALVLGFAAWGVVGIVVMLLLGWLE